MSLGMRETLDAEQRVREHQEAAVVATVVGSGVPQIPLASRLIVREDGQREGEIAPSLDEVLARDSLVLLEERRSHLRSYLVSDESVERVRPQQGNLDVFFEVLARPPRLVIVGAGHIAVPLAQLGSLLEFDVVVLDDRPEYASAERFPTAQQILVGDYRDALRRVSVDKDTYVVLVTRGHVHDQACLELLLDSDASYLGMIGSRRRVRTVMSHLRDADRDPEKLTRVFAPVGLSIGAQTPAEIAVAIMAEIVNVRRRGHARSIATRDTAHV